MPAPWHKFASVSIFLLSSIIAGGKDNPCLHRTVLVSAIENSGKQVSGLNASRFDARLGRDRIQILSVMPAPAERRAVLLLDASGSMGGDRVHEKWPTAVGLATEVVSTAPATLSLGMIAFSAKLLEQVDFGPAARDQMASKLQNYARMSPSGQTPLLDAISRAVGMLEPVRVADSIYLISDAGDNFSKETIEGVRTTIRKIRSRTSFEILLLPTRLLTFEIMLQYIRKPARCQRTTVSGVTTRSDFFQSDQNPRARTQKSLSRTASLGRRFRRLNTLSC